MRVAWSCIQIAIFFPADWFFESDSVEIKPESRRLVEEIARMTRNRMPWSRIVIAVYNTSQDPAAAYPQHLTKRRAEELAVAFVGVGMEPRRILTQAVTISEPILIDPDGLSWAISSSSRDNCPGSLEIRIWERT